VITENQWKIYSFLLSFFVIGRLWMSRHRIFEQIKAYNRRLMNVNLWWLLTIVVLPFPTEMIGGFDDDRSSWPSRSRHSSPESAISRCCCSC
jgi:uncharacterized membrane protein